VKERKGPFGLMVGGIVDTVVQGARRRAQDREPRVLLYDAAGHPRRVGQDAPGRDELITTAGRLIELVGGLTATDAEAEPDEATTVEAEPEDAAAVSAVEADPAEAEPAADAEVVSDAEVVTDADVVDTDDVATADDEVATTAEAVSDAEVVAPGESDEAEADAPGGARGQAGGSDGPDSAADPPDSADGPDSAADPPDPPRP